MAGKSGYIKIYRQLLNWGWYKNMNTKSLFIHLLLKANYKDLIFEGHKIQRGQLVTSLPSLATELGMTQKQIRGSLEHLISTGEVTSQARPRYRIITIVNYEDYQADDSQEGSQKADERAVKGQPEGSQRAGSGQAEGSQRAASKEYKEIEEQKERKNHKKGEGFRPPSLDEVRAFILENGYHVDPEKWFSYYSSNGFMVGRNHMKDWKACVMKWERDEKKSSDNQKAPVKPVIAQQYTQRDYSTPADSSSYDDFMDRLDQLMK